MPALSKKSYANETFPDDVLMIIKGSAARPCLTETALIYCHRATTRYKLRQQGKTNGTQFSLITLLTDHGLSHNTARALHLSSVHAPVYAR